MLRDYQRDALKEMTKLLTGEELAEALHLPTKRTYYVIGIVLREHDLVPCVVYTSGDSIRWSRPLADILYGSNWEWADESNEVFSALSRQLAVFGGEEPAYDFSALHH